MGCRAGNVHHRHSPLLCHTWSDQAEFAGRKPLAVASQGLHITRCDDNVVFLLPLVDLGQVVKRLSAATECRSQVGSQICSRKPGKHVGLA